MRKREMLITCVAFSLQQCSLRSFRLLLDYTQFLLIRKFVLVILLICAYFCYIYGVQEKKLMHNLRKYDVPLHRYMAMMDLQVIAPCLISHWFLKGYLFMENSQFILYTFCKCVYIALYIICVSIVQVYIASTILTYKSPLFI